MSAWIENNVGQKFPIDGNCYLGRSQANTIRLQSANASRRHAHIHAQQSGNLTEYWIADLGSKNGTLHNGRRVVIPSLLRDRDTIGILDETFTFHQEEAAPPPPVEDTGTGPTKLWNSEDLCWLLMIDIKRYTTLSRENTSEELSTTVGSWLRQCRDCIESANGVVDKFLGDAIFAYWKHHAATPAQIFGAVRRLGAIQQTRNPDFRIVLHHGLATLGGGAGGADNLSGPEIVYVFRMEKVCSRLEADTMLSAAARRALPADLAFESLGHHPLDGFPGTHEMFRCPPALNPG